MPCGRRHTECVRPAVPGYSPAVLEAELARRRAQNLVARRTDPRSVTPSIRGFAQAIDRQRAAVERVPLLNASRPDLVAVCAALDEAEVAALALTIDDPAAELPRFAEAARAVGVPVLRADLLLEEFQILESRVAGADAVLLVASALPGPLLERLAGAARSTHMAAVVACADRAEIDRAVAAGAAAVALYSPELCGAVPRRVLAVALPLGAQTPDAAPLRGRADALLDPGLDSASAFRRLLEES